MKKAVQCLTKSHLIVTSLLAMASTIGLFSVLMIIIVLMNCCLLASGLMCYTCSNNIPGPSVCESDPNIAYTGRPITNCTSDRSCYVELNFQDGLVWSFGRGCDIKDEFRPWGQCVLSHEGMRCDCYTICDTDYCNSGTGVPEGYKSPCVKPGEKPHPGLGLTSTKKWKNSTSKLSVNLFLMSCCIIVIVKKIL